MPRHAALLALALLSGGRVVARAAGHRLVPLRFSGRGDAG